MSSLNMRSLASRWAWKPNKFLSSESSDQRQMNKMYRENPKWELLLGKDTISSKLHFILSSNIAYEFLILAVFVFEHLDDNVTNSAFIHICSYMLIKECWKLIKNRLYLKQENVHIYISVISELIDGEKEYIVLMHPETFI